MNHIQQCITNVSKGGKIIEIVVIWIRISENSVYISMKINLQMPHEIFWKKKKKRKERRTNSGAALK